VGNGTQAAGQYPAILLDTCAGFVIEGNRIGYETAHDGIEESSQGHAIQLGTRSDNVICRSNYVGGVHEHCVAYCSLATDGARGNTIESPGGIVTTRGSWHGVTVKRRAVPFAESIVFDATGSEQFDVTATSHADFSIAAPTSPVSDKVITVTVRNASGGALGKTTWNAAFKISAWTNPADGHSRSVVLRFDGAHWVQIGQTGSDIPN
jgi:hypothetical protein